MDFTQVSTVVAIVVIAYLIGYGAKVVSNVKDEVIPVIVGVCGGILGVVTVAMCNVIVPKLPAYQLSLFMFCGQLFCGMMLDVFGGGMLNKREFGAGILVAAGIAVSQVAKICRERKHCTGI